MSYLAIILGAVAVMILGFIWFHPKVFGQSWMQGADLTEEDMKTPNPMIMVGGLLMALVISYATSKYASHTEPGMSQFVHGLYHGFMPAIFYVAPVLVSKGLFEKKNLGWIITGAVYWVIAISLVGGIVYALTPVAEVAG
jgi:hypothetical protein